MRPLGACEEGPLLKQLVAKTQQIEALEKKLQVSEEQSSGAVIQRNLLLALLAGGAVVYLLTRKRR